MFFGEDFIGVYPGDFLCVLNCRTHKLKFFVGTRVSLLSFITSRIFFEKVPYVWFEFSIF